VQTFEKMLDRERERESVVRRERESERC
jgi:hypothetical protein